jgi:hypothetical protein
VTYHKNLTARQKKMMGVLKKQGALGILGTYKTENPKMRIIKVIPSNYVNDTNGNKANLYLPLQFGSNNNKPHNRMDIEGMERTLKMFNSKKINSEYC